LKPHSPHRITHSIKECLRKLKAAWRSALTASTLCAALAGSAITYTGHASDIDLPDLGDSTSGIVSLQQEKELGTAWLASFRRQVKVVDDPLLEDYLEDLIYRLVIHNNQLKERDLQLVVISNPTINAFAVPGGIIGVHNGLLQYAQNEDQLAAVLAHELGHLSQRHFARSLEEQRSSSLRPPVAMPALPRYQQRRPLQSRTSYVFHVKTSRKPIALAWQRLPPPT
jgi:predicted Zn-dependent protease